MCGIAGIARLDGGSPGRQRLSAMGAAIAHRGPDGEGILVDGSVGLVHRRLAIIDLSTGDQPMANEDGNVLTVFNGEIYNFRSVQPELERAGHAFRTHSDTEVLVHGWETWGRALPEKLNGMFAFAILDRRARKLFMARDRLGVKPLYWHRGKDEFVFASEMGALLASGSVPKEIDPDALELYLHYQYVPAPRTIYRDVHKLEPGHWLELDLESGKITTGRYWRLDPERGIERGRPLESWIEELETVLQDAVRIRLISDVPFGAFLSGGTDSGLVVSLMAGLLGEPVRTFSIGIADAADELPRARQVAEKWKTHHEEFRVSPEGLALIPRLAPHFGEPFADSSAVPTWYVSKMAHSRVKMVLTGDGGDEMFAGYRSYAGVAGARPDGLRAAGEVKRAREPRSMRALASKGRGLARGVVRALLGRGPVPRRRESHGWIEIYDGWMSHFSEDERRALLGRSAHLSGPDFVWKQFPYPGADSVVAAAQYSDLHSYLPDDILVKVDRMSMAHSLEVRSPLLDYRIAELAFRMPTGIKLPEARPDASRGKFVLKELAAKLLGKDYVYAPKEGFGIPISRWLREDSSGYVRDSLLASESPIFGALDREVVRGFVRDHLEGRAERSTHLWNLLMLDAWFRYVHLAPRPGEGVARPAEIATAPEAERAR